MTELQPCPICKGTRICMDGGDNTYHPRCLDCGCTAPFDAWQSRTPAPAEVERHGISEGRAMVIAHGEPFQEQTDPLAEWKALEPGRKVLIVSTMNVVRVKSAKQNRIDFDDESWIEPSDFLDSCQILHEGPFDAGKLKVGDWVWLDRNKTFYNTCPETGWHTIRRVTKDFIILETSGFHFGIDGLCSGDDPGNGARLHFSPPTPPSREERIEKAAKKILGLRKDCLYCEDHGLCEAEISIVLTELMEGKP